jgi:hypothetical protein
MSIVISMMFITLPGNITALSFKVSMHEVEGEEFQNWRRHMKNKHGVHGEELAQEAQAAEALDEGVD